MSHSTRKTANDRILQRTWSKRISGAITEAITSEEVLGYLPCIHSNNENGKIFVSFKKITYKTFRDAPPTTDDELTLAIYKYFLVRWNAKNMLHFMHSPSPQNADKLISYFPTPNEITKRAIKKLSTSVSSDTLDLTSASKIKYKINSIIDLDIKALKAVKGLFQTTKIQTMLQDENVKQYYESIGLDLAKLTPETLESWIDLLNKTKEDFNQNPEPFYKKMKNIQKLIDENIEEKINFKGE